MADAARRRAWMKTTAARCLYIASALIAVATLDSPGRVPAWAEEARSVYVPLIFNAEGKFIQTAACLQVTERIYRRPAWWMDRTTNDDAAGEALKAVLAAIRDKDRAALYRRSHPALGRDPTQFDTQAQAYFQQLAALRLLAVPRAYAFDGLWVFLADFRLKDHDLLAPLVFAAEDDGSVGFLPYRSDAVTYRLVERWIYHGGAGAGRGAGPYCTGEDVRRATHRISLGMPVVASRPSQHPSALFLRGASFDRPGELTTLVTRLLPAIAGLKSAVLQGRIEDFTAHLTPDGARRLKEWFATAGPSERHRYATTIAEQQPFFVFDLSSVAVVYTRAPDGVQVMYFTAGRGGEPLWLNSSYATDSDRIFKKGPLFGAASQALPFGGIAIK